MLTTVLIPKNLTTYIEQRCGSSGEQICSTNRIIEQDLRPLRPEQSSQPVTPTPLDTQPLWNWLFLRNKGTTLIVRLLLDPRICLLPFEGGLLRLGVQSQ